jgi:glycosyltransferase involved in cell wall biosynthesis
MTTLNVYPLTGFDPFQAYGKVEMGLWYSLALQGVELTLLGHVRPDWYSFDQEAQLLGAGRQVADITLMTANLDKAGTYPVKSTRKWLYTMVECTRLGDIMVDHINRLAERVLVPVPALVDVFYESGVKRPVHHIGYGADFCAPEWRAHSLPALTPDDPFIFLTYSQGDRRKGAEMVIQAFLEDYQGRPEYQLWIKARDGYQDTWLGGVANANLPNVKVIGGVQSDAQWHELLYQAHCMVFLTRGEGIGYVPRDAVQAGLPAITTQWLGTYDADRWGLAVPLAGLLPVNHPGKFYERRNEDNFWAVPDVAETKRLMRWVAEHYDQATQMTRVGRAYLLTQTYSQVAKSIKQLLERYG